MWNCSACGEELEDTFDTCWKCGTTIDGIQAPSFSPESDFETESLDEIQHVFRTDPESNSSVNSLKPRNSVVPEQQSPEWLLLDPERQFKWGAGIAVFGCLSLVAAMIVYSLVGPKVPWDYFMFVANTLMASLCLAVLCSVVAVVFLVCSVCRSEEKRHQSIFAIVAVAVFWTFILQVRLGSP